MGQDATWRRTVARIGITISLTAMLAGCQVARLQGFDTLAARDELAPTLLSGLPLGDKGSFRLGDARGTVQWWSGSDAVGWGPDGFGPKADLVRVGEVARFGAYAFDLGGDGLPGHLEARCRYARTEARNRLFVLDLASAGRPLRLQCLYRLDGRDMGMLQLSAMPPRSAIAEPRRGMIRFDGQALTLESMHGIEGIRQESDNAMGYRLTDADGRVVGLIETNGGRDRRLLISRVPAQRTAALAAALSLALFRDPGDID